MGCLGSFGAFPSPYETSYSGPGSTFPKRKVLCSFNAQKVINF